MTAATAAPETITVDAGDVALGARRWAAGGSERPVLLVHGLSSNARLWDEVAARLAARDHPVLSVDLRGHGTSASCPDPTSASCPDPTSRPEPTHTAAADLAGVCTGLGWTAPVVAGQSWGGNVVLQLAADRPDLVHGLALVDGGWLHLGDRWGSVEQAWTTLAPPDLSGVPGEVLRARLATAHSGWSRAALAATMANLELLPDGTVRPWLSHERHRRIVAGMLEHRPRELYPLVRCHCVLLAAGDPPYPAAEQALAALPAGSSLIGFPGGDHDLHAQHPDRVAAAIEGLA